MDTPVAVPAALTRTIASGPAWLVRAAERHLESPTFLGVAVMWGYAVIAADEGASRRVAEHVAEWATRHGAQVRIAAEPAISDLLDGLRRGPADAAWFCRATDIELAVDVCSFSGDRSMLWSATTHLRIRRAVAQASSLRPRPAARDRLIAALAPLFHCGEFGHWLRNSNVCMAAGKEWEDARAAYFEVAGLDMAAEDAETEALEERVEAQSAAIRAEMLAKYPRAPDPRADTLRDIMDALVGTVYLRTRSQASGDATGATRADEEERAAMVRLLAHYEQFRG